MQPGPEVTTADELRGPRESCLGGSLEQAMKVEIESLRKSANTSLVYLQTLVGPCDLRSFCPWKLFESGLSMASAPSNGTGGRPLLGFASETLETSPGWRALWISATWFGISASVGG